MTSDPRKSPAAPARPQTLTMDTSSGWTPSNQLHTGLTPVASQPAATSLSPFVAFNITSPAGHFSDGGSTYGAASDFTTPSYDDDQLVHFTPMVTVDEQPYQPPPPPPPPPPADTADYADQTSLPPTRQGIDPAGRARINFADDNAMPTLDEQQKQRDVETTKVGVRQWLQVTVPGTDQEVAEEDRKRESFVRRVRAKSTGDANRPRKPLSDDERPESWVSREAYCQEDSDDSNEDDANSSGTETEQYDTVDLHPAAVGGQPRASISSQIHNALLRQDSYASSFRGRPWNDPLYNSENTKQPYTSSDAMTKFQQRVKDLETASVTATIGTRRRSEADVASLYSASGLSMRNVSLAPELPADELLKTSSMEQPRLAPLVAPPLPANPSHAARQRRPSIMDKFKRPRDSAKKRTNDDRSIIAEPSAPQEDQIMPLSPARRPSLLSKSGKNVAGKLDHRASFSSLKQSAISKLRSRSPSVASGGIADRWRQTGGPPVMNLPGKEPLAISPPMQALAHFPTETYAAAAPNPSAATSIPPPMHTPLVHAPVPIYPKTSVPAPLQPETTSRMPFQDDDDEEPSFALSSAPDQPSKIQPVPTAATIEAFKAHITQLERTQAIPHYMVERLAQEQLRRYTRLYEAAKKHGRFTGQCKSGVRCKHADGPNLLTPRAQRAADAAPVVFYVNPSDREEQQQEDDATTCVATFPAGVPLPPPTRLPAEFECPLCFQVKKIIKPSDWSKHVHEDVQPFTCTFPDCNEAKSFKRKADWVRHENERHRHLESWHCSIDNCEHVCFRKNNFQEHLVREHRMPEIRERRPTGTSLSSGSPMQMTVSDLVESCRRESDQRPETEPCRFCGEVCNSWKKLQVHLASHLLQISMPVLEMPGLVEGLRVAKASSSGHPSPSEAGDGSGISRGISVSPKTQSPAIKQDPGTRPGSTFPPMPATGPAYLQVPQEAVALPEQPQPYMQAAPMHSYPPVYDAHRATPIARERQGSWLALNDDAPATEMMSPENLALNSQLHASPYMSYPAPSPVRNPWQTPHNSSSATYSSPSFNNGLEVPPGSYSHSSYFTPPSNALGQRPHTASMVHQGTFFDEPDEFSVNEEASPRTSANPYHMQQWQPSYGHGAMPGWQQGFTIQQSGMGQQGLDAMRSNATMHRQYDHDGAQVMLDQMPLAAQRKLSNSVSHAHLGRSAAVGDTDRENTWM